MRFLIVIQGFRDLRDGKVTGYSVFLVGAIIVGLGMSIYERVRPREPTRTASSAVQAPPPSSPPAHEEAQPGGPSADLSWMVTSGSGAAVLEQTLLGAGSKDCTLVCRVGEKQIWTSSGCVGGRIDHRFVSDDCARLAVMHPVPDRSGAWQNAKVAHVYKRDGKLDYAVSAGAIVTGPAAKHMDASVRWLLGTPAYTADGTKISFRSVDGREQFIPLTAK
jgi:hypothetical protein